MRDPRWHWRNTRSLILHAGLHPLHWRLQVVVESDFEHFAFRLTAGPLTVGVEADRGDPGNWFGLSSLEAWRRACRWEGLADG